MDNCIGHTHRIGVSYWSTKIDRYRLENEGYALRAEERVGSSGPAELMADGGYPMYAT